MNNAAYQLPWKIIAGLVIAAVVLDLGLSVRPGQAEDCSISSYHEGMAFPVGEIDHDWKCRLHSVIEGAAIRSTVGPVRAALPESIYLYLLDHPPLAAGLIHRLELGPYRSEVRGPNRFWGDDGEGTKGMVQLVYQDPASRIYYLEGSRDSRLLPSLTGKAVVFLKMSAVKEGGGEEAMDSTLVAYTKLDNRVLSGLVSMLRPLVSGMVTSKLRKGVETVNRLGQVMREHPERVLVAAAAPPSFQENDVAFLREALRSRYDSSGSNRKHRVLP